MKKVLATILFLTLATPSFAANKEMIQLQTQIQQLQDAVARLQQSNDERMGVLKDLVQQSADSVNRMSVNMDSLQKQLAARSQAQDAKADQLSGQVSSLNDTLDEIKARMARLEKVLADVQGQQQNIGAALQNLPQAGTPQTTVQPTPAPAVTQSIPDQTAIAPPAAPIRTPPVRKPVAPSAPPADDLYKAAYGDYMAAKYGIASSEFGDVIKAYPDNTLAGNSFYYLGEIDYRAGKYAAAAKDYDHVLEQFSDNNKVPAAHLHKGQALIALKQQEAGVRELRTLIQRFPASPEAAQARSKLNALGIPIKPKA